MISFSCSKADDIEEINTATDSSTVQDIDTTTYPLTIWLSQIYCDQHYLSLYAKFQGEIVGELKQCYSTRPSSCYAAQTVRLRLRSGSKYLIKVTDNYYDDLYEASYEVEYEGSECQFLAVGN